MNIQKLLLLLSVLSVLLLSGCSLKETMKSLSSDSRGEGNITGTVVADLEGVPEFQGESFVVINDNKPEFEESDYSTESFEDYSELDSLGRCGVAVANVGKDLMPVKERESISPVKPSGWQTAKYDCVEGKYLYNRCHLIGYQLSGENANKKNLVTGTRYMNVEGMLPFENEVADYVRETNNHVLYRVTPVYEGDNLVASGIQMEAWSVEMKEKAFVLTSMPTITSPAWRSIMPREKVAWRGMRSRKKSQKNLLIKHPGRRPVRRGGTYAIPIPANSTNRIVPVQRIQKGKTGKRRRRQESS